MSCFSSSALRTSCCFSIYLSLTSIYSFNPSCPGGDLQQAVLLNTPVLFPSNFSSSTFSVFSPFHCRSFSSISCHFLPFWPLLISSQLPLWRCRNSINLIFSSVFFTNTILSPVQPARSSSHFNFLSPRHRSQMGFGGRGLNAPQLLWTGVSYWWQAGINHLCFQVPFTELWLQKASDGSLIFFYSCQLFFHTYYLLFADDVENYL